MMIQEILFLTVLIYIISTIYYYRYLKSPSNGVKLIIILLTLEIFIITTVMPFIAPLISTFILTINYIFLYYKIIFSIISLIIISATVYPYRRRLKCLKREISAIDDVKFMVCYGGTVNALYRVSRGDIQVSDKLLEILNGEELKAVVFHEVGHKKHRIVTIMVFFNKILWMLFLILAITSVVTILFVWMLNPISITLSEFLSSLMSLTLIASSTSLATMLCDWLSEHEADIYASEEVGIRSLTSALIKIHIYKGLNAEGINWSNMKTHLNLNSQYLELMRDYRLKDILVLLLSKSFLNALKIIEISRAFRRPLPETHPPLGLRIRKLLSLSSGP